MLNKRESVLVKPRRGFDPKTFDCSAVKSGRHLSGLEETYKYSFYLLEEEEGTETIVYKTETLSHVIWTLYYFRLECYFVADENFPCLTTLIKVL